MVGNEFLYEYFFLITFETHFERKKLYIICANIFQMQKTLSNKQIQIHKHGIYICCNNNRDPEIIFLMLFVVSL